MCCRTNVFPIDRNIAASILTIGMFEPVYFLPGRPDIAVNWERLVPEEGCIVRASITSESLDLNISPAISSYGHHANKRITASLYFEIAAKYAEKVGGEIIQRATVVGCKHSYQPQDLVIGHYPSSPLSFTKVCPGFQAVLLGSHDHN